MCPGATELDTMTPIVRPATPADLPAILAIYNDAVVSTTAIWNDAMVDLAERTRWYEARLAGGFPVLVAEVDGAVAGYASYGAFRAFEGYARTSELSVYVEKDQRGGGIGRTLLGALVEEAEWRGVHVLVAGIEAGNTASIRLHEKAGFVETGRMPEVGRKFGRWLDLVWMQRVFAG
jgi:phosphinothricin acetyltransferase